MNEYKDLNNIKNRNFWAYYPLILVLVNLVFLIPALLRGNDLELMGIPVLINAYFIISALPFVIILLIWPTKILKSIINMIISLIFIPIILLFLFFTVGVPVLSGQHEKEVTQIKLDIDNKSLIPISVEGKGVLFPGNVIIFLGNSIMGGDREACQFPPVFTQEVINKKENVKIILSPSSYVSTFTASSNESWLVLGEKYTHIDGELQLKDEPINTIWLRKNINGNEEAINCEKKFPY